MAKPIEPAELDKAAKLVETAMKTEAKKAKQREEQRKKAEDALEAFKDNYAARTKEMVAKKKHTVTDLEKAVGVAEHELAKDHPLVAKLNDLIDKAKKVPYEPRYDELDKAIHALEDWDVAVEKTDQPKKAITQIGKTKEAIDSALADIKKAVDDYMKVAEAAKKDLGDVEDADVKKELTAILEGELP